MLAITPITIETADVGSLKRPFRYGTLKSKCQIGYGACARYVEPRKEPVFCSTVLNSMYFVKFQPNAPVPACGNERTMFDIRAVLRDGGPACAFASGFPWPSSPSALLPSQHRR